MQELYGRHQSLGLIKKSEAFLTELLFDGFKIHSTTLATSAGTAFRFGRKAPVDHTGHVEHRNPKDQEDNNVLDHDVKIVFGYVF